MGLPARFGSQDIAEPVVGARASRHPVSKYDFDAMSATRGAGAAERFPMPGGNVDSVPPVRPGRGQVRAAPSRWHLPCANAECSLHQLSPYIGKIKSTIAGDLVDKYSRRGDLVVDPFAGAGTIPLEAVLRERRVFCGDVSPYAEILSKAKLTPPTSLDAALRLAEAALLEARCRAVPDLRSVPRWVRSFFHPRTLREAIQFAEVARAPGNEFLMACFLGILHHQRPGFLSHPSSHLVPYLRTLKFPPKVYPELYDYRELRPRLLAKVRRTYKRFHLPAAKRCEFHRAKVQQLSFPPRFDAMITSPPYMNALDYGRDNRLRLWFIDPSFSADGDRSMTSRRGAFVEAISAIARGLQTGLRRRGHCVLVVGEETQRSYEAHPSEVVLRLMSDLAPSLRLVGVISDDIPDIRRSRQECRGVKREHVLTFIRR